MNRFRRDDIPKGQQMIMSYPNIQRLLVGLHYAYQERSGKITLIYEDKTTESRQADFRIEDRGIFAVVSFVQAARIAA